eukprot:PLAT7474.1.p1 GENE.PLAT7474.1~~PLAT7474.1.p1  ORF type:complete len:535 (+),score=242.67 PLAT7474.1:73-1605(+)
MTFKPALLVALALLATGAHAVWPMPASQTMGSGSLSVDSSFQWNVTGKTDDVLAAALKRTRAFMLGPSGGAAAQRSSATSRLTSVEVFVADLADLQPEVSENYTLSIASDGRAELHAYTQWGALYGLETLAQLVDFDASTSAFSISGVPLTIQDSPRFPHRGFMIDSSRHYLPVETILSVIESMAYHKLNVLHWHAVDAQSFPVVIPSRPKLAEEAAWAAGASWRYSAQDIATVIAHGRMYGIRVLPEFDIPGHAYSWGKGYPSVTASCPSYAHNINNIPLNPVVNATWDVVSDVISYVGSSFNDSWMHTGGDEVVFGCWTEDDSIAAWIKQHDSSALGVEQLFQDKLKPLVSSAGKTQVVWEDMFNNGVKLPSDTVIEVWSTFQTLAKVLRAGYRALLAQCWYLDMESWTWETFYNCEPTSLPSGNYTPAQLANLKGGEIAAWAEHLNAINIFQQMFPRTSAAAERLWSPKHVTSTTDALPRLVELQCRMVRRGVAFPPLQPSVCVPLP